MPLCIPQSRLERSTTNMHDLVLTQFSSEQPTPWNVAEDASVSMISGGGQSARVAVTLPCVHHVFLQIVNTSCTL